ncbi:SLC13 family permease, partial [Janibacter corallicola]|uniref:SLC13 family permease n=1 Tax=Janibacter corallicola TaxID=415212 RepID=UPI002480A201
MNGVAVVDVLTRTLPVIAFLLTITVVAEAADLAGVFDVAGHAAARVAGGRVLVLWLLLAGLAVVVTAVLSLDTTAVLLTPVALAVARQLRLPVAPFAMTTLFLANTASLFLPVSNLTNLLAMGRFAMLGVDQADFVRLALAPGAAAVVGTMLVLWCTHRGSLRGTFVREASAGRHDP